MSELVRTKARAMQQANRQRYEQIRRDLADEGLLTVEGTVIDDGQVAIEPADAELPTSNAEVEGHGSASALPGHIPTVKVLEFEHQVSTALADLTQVARDDPDEFHSFPFQETVQNKITKAVTKLEDVLET